MPIGFLKTRRGVSRNPVAARKDHPLNRGLVAWYLALPSAHGRAYQFRDLMAECHGILTSGPVWQGPQGRPGGRGSLKVTGTEYVDLGTTAINLTGDCTLSCWFNSLTVSGVKLIFGDGSVAAASQIAITINDTAAKLSIRWGTNHVVGTSATSLVANTWYHCVAVRTGSAGAWSWVIYLNGISDGSGSGETVNPSAMTRYCLGRGGNLASNQFTGLLDDCRFYSRALSADDVRRLYSLSLRGYPGLLNRPAARWAGSVSLAPWIPCPLIVYPPELPEDYW